MKLTKFIKKWCKNNRQILAFIPAAFVIWQLAVAIIIALGVRHFPTTNAYLYGEGGKGRVIINPKWLWSRANFDGIHYLDIARRGYGIYQQAFFPLYPRLIRWLAPYFGGRDLVTGLTISWVSFFLALFFFYKLIRLDWEEKYARRAIVYLLIFPTAFFFSMLYTESLFLFLVLGSFYFARNKVLPEAGSYFARTKRWWLAGIFGAFASATRVVGIFLLPALLVEFWQSEEKLIKSKNVSRIASHLLPLLLIPLGLLYYMRFLQINYQDPLMFIHVQPYFGAGRTAGKIILLYQVFWRYLKMLITVEKFTPTYYVCVLEALTGVAFLLLTIFVYLRRWFSYVTFMALAYIAPTLSGTLLSVPRFVLVLFPGFILLALWAEKYKWIRILYPLIAIPLLIIFLLFFSRGYWVA